MSNNKQQTAVESLVEKLASLTFDYMAGFISKREYDQLSKGVIRQAKEIEKRQIVDAWSNGFDEDDRATSNPFKYYNETYGGNK